MPSGKQWSNVIHCRYAAGASTPGPTEIANLDAVLHRLYDGAVFGAGDFWLHFAPAAVTLIDAQYYVLFGGAPPITVTHTAAGTGAGTACPSEVAAVVTLRTGTRGRSYRGRTFLPAPNTAQIASGGVLAAANITSTLAQWSGCQTALNAIQWSIGVASYLHSTFNDATSFTMDNRFDVIRHRKG